MGRIEKEWNSYRLAVIPAGAGEIQIEECKRAFYAGAATLHHELMEMLSPGDETTDADLENMQAIHDELIAFGVSRDPRRPN